MYCVEVKDMGNKPTIELSNDGTLDTVLRCSECGQEFRGNYGAACRYPDESATDAERFADYDAFVESFIEDVADKHECNEGVTE